VLVSHDFGVVAGWRTGCSAARRPHGGDRARRALFADPRSPTPGSCWRASLGCPTSRALGAAPPRGHLRARPAGYGGRPVVDDVSLELRRARCWRWWGVGQRQVHLARRWPGCARRARCAALPRGTGRDLAVPAGKRPLDLRRRVALVFQNATPRSTGAACATRCAVADIVRDRPRAERAARTTSCCATSRWIPATGTAARAAVRRSAPAGRHRPRAGRRTRRDHRGRDHHGVGRVGAGAGAGPARRTAPGTPLACLFISHDLAVVRGIADRILVLYQGKVVEQGSTRAVFAGPNHPTPRADQRGAGT